MTVQKWTDERVATLQGLVGAERPVSVATITTAATELNTSERSIASKLRKMGFEVASLAKESVPTFSDAEASELEAFVKSNSGTLTYAEIATSFAEGKFTAKQVQGKILSMELTSHVKPTEKVEVARQYTPEEEAKFIEMCNSGSFVEDIATAMGKSTNSVRGKALSLLRTNSITKIPSQKESHAKVETDAIEALGDISAMTVTEIATKTGKTERGIKTTLTRRGLVASDYNGKAKKEKSAAKAAE